MVFIRSGLGIIGNIRKEREINTFVETLEKSFFQVILVVL